MYDRKVAGWWEGKPGEHGHSLLNHASSFAWCQGQESISVIILLQNSGKGLLLEVTTCISKSLLFSIYPLFECLSDIMV